MPSPESLSKTLPVLILNACPDLDLQKRRAKILNDAGYYTSSAATTDEVSRLSVRLNCTLAVVCHSFSPAERKTIKDQLLKDSPATRLLVLDHDLDSEPKNLLANIKKALYKLEIVHPDERSA